MRTLMLYLMLGCLLAGCANDIAGLTLQQRLQLYALTATAVGQPAVGAGLGVLAAGIKPGPAQRATTKGGMK